MRDTFLGLAVYHDSQANVYAIAYAERGFAHDHEEMIKHRAKRDAFTQTVEILDEALAILRGDHA